MVNASDNERGPAPVAKLLLTVDEAAERLSMSRTRLYGLLGRHIIFSIKEGRARLVPVAELERYVARRVAEAAEQVGMVSTGMPLSSLSALGYSRQGQRRMEGQYGASRAR
jgi:excisionase family DNA binding protein